MYELSEETKKSIEYTIERTLGISYGEFMQLDFYEQQELIKQYHKNHP